VLIAAAVCPQPPLLVPELAGATSPEIDALRAACHEAVRRLLAPAPGVRTPPSDRAADLLVVVGGDAATRAYGPDAAGSLRPYGLDLTIGPGEPVLPLSLTIGRWLLQSSFDAGGVRVRFQGVAERAAPAECLRLGRHLAEAAERVALLVMGDGSACRAEKAGDDDLDDRAEPYDAAVARALRDADAAALAALDPRLSGELQVAGRAAWQVLAGAAGAAGFGAAGFSAAVLAEMAPYGVGYFAASWLPNPDRIGRRGGAPG
jgi:hypothetical protein